MLQRWMDWIGLYNLAFLIAIGLIAGAIWLLIYIAAEIDRWRERKNKHDPSSDWKEP
jgi:hypothetical protein